LTWAGCDGRYDLPVAELAGLVSDRGPGDDDGVRAVLGHMARAGVLTPASGPHDRAVGQITGGWDPRAAARCVASSRDGERVRWNQYRSVWGYVEGDGCRRRALLDHFGDGSAGAPLAGVPCCDVCEPSLVPAPRAVRVVPGSAGAGAGDGSLDLDDAILGVVGTAQPPVGRTRAVEILRGGRSKVVVQNAYDGLAAYGAFAHLRSEEVLGRVDELLRVGTLRSTGGRFPKLAAA
jgi:ATP-dependent DNA helicase RecQ